MPSGRRHPPPLPHLSALVPTPVGPDGKLSQGSIGVMYNGILGALRKQEEFNRSILDGFSGLPAQHAHTHSVGQSDPLDTPGVPLTVRAGGVATIGNGPSAMREDVQLVGAVGTPADLGDAADVGAGPLFATSLHVHKRQIRVYKGGVLVGTRRDLNLIQGSNMTLTITDNAGADRIDATFASTGGGGGGVSAAYVQAQARRWAWMFGMGI